MFCLQKQPIQPPRRILRCALLCLLGCSFSPALFSAQEFVLFPEVRLTHRSGVAPDVRLDDNDLDGELNVFYTFDKNRFRFLVETFLSEDEKEVERLQLGWLITPGTTVWLGRVHNPIGYWNTAYHHGTYLQTSVTRPGIHEYEDRGGPLPSHVTGLMVDGMITRGRGEYRYLAAYGAGPELEEHLEPVDILSPGSGRHRQTGTVRLGYLPDVAAETEAGFFIGYSRIPGETPVRDVRLKLAGFYGMWESSKFKLLAEVFFIDTTEELTTGRTSGAFRSGYVQAEYGEKNSITYYGRVEDTGGEGNDSYLARFNEFIAKRVLAGVRWDFARQQALSLELSGNELMSDRFRQLTLQWSGSFP